MALLHIAWFRFKEGVAQDRIDRHLTACRALVGQVPVVRDLQCGPNTSNLPAHVPVAKELVADIAELRVMDLAV